MEDGLVAQTLVLAFLHEGILVVVVLLLQGFEVEVFGMTEGFVDSLLGALGIAAPQGKLGKVALHDVCRLQVIAGLHGTIDRFGLGQRVATDKAARQHLLCAEFEMIGGTSGGLASIAQCLAVRVHGPMDVGETREGLAHEFRAEGVLRGYSEIVGTARIVEGFVEVLVAVESDLARVRTYII